MFITFLNIRDITNLTHMSKHIFGILSYMRSLSLGQPHLLITVGIPGSGKSFFAERFAATFNAPLINYSDIMEIVGQNGMVSDALAGYMLKELFKTKQSIVFDGPTSTRAERTALKDLAEAYGYKSLFIWTQTDIDTARARYIKEQKKNGRAITPTQYDALAKVFVPPIAKEHPTVVISGKHTYATQAKAVLKNLAVIKQVARSNAPANPREQVAIKVHKRNPTSL